MNRFLNLAAYKFAVVAALSIIPTVAHYATDAHNGPAHDIYQRIYYLPIILAGLWFGMRGGLFTVVLISIAFFPHAIHGWHGPNSLFYRCLEIVMYLVVGWLTGWLADKLRDANEVERSTRQEVELAYKNLKIKTEELFTLEEQLRRSDRLAALGQLSAGLAHEIRNPLASVKTSAEMLRNREAHVVKNPKEPDFTRIILEETARLDRILTEFLQFARAEQLRPTDEPHSTRLSTSLKHVLQLTEATLQQQNVRVVYNEPEFSVTVGICDSHLRQVFLNLLLNSLDAMPTGGEFQIRRVAQEGKLFVLEVEDTGPGIPHEHAAKIFNPFYSTKTQGTGLGLSIVERILDSHGGSITLAQRDALPTARFVVSLPITS